MKVLILLGLVVASQAVAVVYHHPGLYHHGVTAYQTKDGIGNYAFGHATYPGGPSFHTESGDISGRKVGSYGLKDADGKLKVVEYVADAGGFRANIKTSEKLDKDHKDAANVKTTEAEHILPSVYGHPYVYWV